MSIKDKLAGWIDTDVIAEHILGELEDQGIPATFQNAKTVWMDLRETELCDAISSSVKVTFEVV